MSKPSSSGSLLFFFVKFLLLVAVLSWAWWEYAMPRYAELIARIGPPIFEHVFGIPGMEGHVKLAEDDLFNTQTALVWTEPDGGGGTTYIAMLVTNIPPYIALILATAGLTLWRRLRVLLIGLAILVATHIGFITTAYAYRDAIRGGEDGGPLEFPKAIAEFSLTLPFLLWIVLAYWQKLGEYFAGSTAGPQLGEDDFTLDGAKLLPPEENPASKNAKQDQP